MTGPMQIAPPRAKGFPCKDPFDAPDCVAEEKFDGHRGLMHIGGELDRPYLTGREESKKTGLFTERWFNVPHLTPNPLPVELYIFDCEVLPPEGSQFEDVQSFMGAGPDKADAWQDEHGSARCVLFDILFAAGEDVRGLPAKERRELLQWAHDNLEFPKYTTLAVQHTTGFKALFDGIVAAGGEGIMLKDQTAPYGRGWLKVKAEETVDGVITGYEAGKGKYKGQVGAVQFSQLMGGVLTEVGQCSGMTDEVRADITERQAELLGTVIEVKTNGRTRHRRYRHPRFLRFRFEKPADQCVWGQS